jgi:DNA-binding NarL/FixJ family response regulator
MAKKIIIIDDHSFILKIVPVKLLEFDKLKEFQIIPLKPKKGQNPSEFLEKNKKILSDVQLFIIDNRMIDFDGPELIKYLKENTEFKNTKMICFSIDSNIPELKDLNIPLIKKGEEQEIIDLMKSWDLI